jgi:hypothetical protein
MMTTHNRFSIDPLRGEEAKRFIEFDSSKPTKEDIENQEKAMRTYLKNCKIGK